MPKRLPDDADTGQPAGLPRWRAADLDRLTPDVAQRDARGGRRLKSGDEDARRPRAASAGMSLKARALRFLSQREHSRFELRRKLVRYEEDIAVIDELLSALEKDGWLSTRRFVESVVHRRASVFGVRRIAQELSEHRVPSDEAGDSLAALRQTEFERALALWQRRFDSAPTSLQEKAKQHRFLAARGFDGATIAQVLRHASSDTL